MIFKTKCIKEYGFSKILETLIRDLQILEQDGIEISTQNNSMIVKGTICYIVSDNLAANGIAGLVKSFSSRVSGFCRFCTAHNDDIQHKFNEDELISRIESSSTIGIKTNCCLNDLQYFNILNGQPPDIMHDFLEGVLCLNLGLLMDSIRRFVSVDELKSQLENFKYGRHDGKNKVPFDVFTDRSINKTNGFKLSATHIWVLIRVFPILFVEI
ncbi:unnamed protein product [Brachionus calyciflorus]|uniref:Uncharacterized protein n=1 Tax=Brachionus calyciflorus TaxID=104777 RepID=A0A813NFU5_9BILA|nr:unnamed protein product [Brachionus calyciflorus]